MELTIKWSKVEISRFTPSGWKDILVRDFEFVAKPQFLWDNLIVLDGFQALIFPNVWFIKHFYAAIGRNRALPLMLGFYKAETAHYSLMLSFKGEKVLGVMLGFCLIETEH